MVSKGFKVEKEGYILEVTDVENITEDIQCVDYVVKKGNRELTDGFIYIMKNQNPNQVFNRVLTKIINAVKRVTST